MQPPSPPCPCRSTTPDSPPPYPGPAGPLSLTAPLPTLTLQVRCHPSQSCSQGQHLHHRRQQGSSETPFPSGPASWVGTRSLYTVRVLNSAVAANVNLVFGYVWLGAGPTTTC